MILMLATLAESQTFKRITTSNPNYRWQQYNTYEKIVTRCNSSGVVTDTLSTMDYVRDNMPSLTELYSSRDSVAEALADTTDINTAIEALQYITLPILTQTQINALTPAVGMFVFNSTTGYLNYYSSGAWRQISIE